MRNHWGDHATHEDEQPVRPRDENSSLQSQYEDTVLPDPDLDHDGDS